MKFNPITKTLYTDSGELIKRLHCPLRMQRERLRQNPLNAHRMCSACERTVFDTNDMTDAELLATVQADPSICLSVSAHQANVTIIAEDPMPASSHMLEEDDNAATLVVVQQRPDRFFSARQQQREELTAQRRAAQDTDSDLPLTMQAKLEQLVLAEVRAAGRRAADLLRGKATP